MLNDTDISIDLIDEPEPLIFRKNKDSIILRYRDKSISIESIDDLKSSLTNTSIDLIEYYSNFEDFHNNEMLTVIQNFIKQN